MQIFTVGHSFSLFYLCNLALRPFIVAVISVVKSQSLFKSQYFIEFEKKVLEQRPTLEEENK